MMLGFVVRRCAVDIGHPPDPAEFAFWANNHEADGERYCLFGRAITEVEARIILRHQARVVSARTAAPHERLDSEDEFAKSSARAGTVVSLEEARARLSRTERAGRSGSRR